MKKFLIMLVAGALSQFSAFAANEDSDMFFDPFFFQKLGS